MQLSVVKSETEQVPLLKKHATFSPVGSKSSPITTLSKRFIRGRILRKKDNNNAFNNSGEKQCRD